MSRLEHLDIKAQLRQYHKETKFVYDRIQQIKEDDMRMANEADIFNMDLEAFLEWFDSNASRLFQSVAYSRIKNKHDYGFKQYVETRRRIRRERDETQTSLSIVRRNSKLRSSFTVHSGPMLNFGSTMLFEHALTIQALPHANNEALRYCVQFSNRFTTIAERFCEDIKPEVVMRALQDVKSTAIYHSTSTDILTY